MTTNTRSDVVKAEPGHTCERCGASAVTVDLSPDGTFACGPAGYCISLVLGDPPAPSLD